MSKILFVGHADEYTGLAKVLYALAAGVQHEVVIFGINYHGDPYNHPYRIYAAKNGRDPYGYSLLPQVSRVENPDLIILIADPSVCSSYLDHLQSAGIQVPILIYTPVDASNLPRQLGKSFSHARTVVTTTHWGKDQLAAVGVNAFVIGHGTDPVFSPIEDKAALRKKYGIPVDAFVVGNFNRNQSRKDLPCTIEAFALFANANSDLNPILYLHTEILGDAADSYNLEHLYESFRLRYGLNPLYHTAGAHGFGTHPRATPQQLNELYNCMDVGINTSQAEGWGLIAFEMAAAGIPQILPEHSVHRELWRGAALLVRPATPIYTLDLALKYWKGNPDDYADALELFKDPDLRACYSKLGIQNARKWDWNLIRKEFCQIIESTLHPIVFGKSSADAIRLDLNYSFWAGGIFNPSILQTDKGWLGLARAEPLAYEDPNRISSSPIPYYFELDPYYNVTLQKPIKYVSPFEPYSFRVDDFRLFRYSNKILCSHVFWQHGSSIKQAISLLDTEKESLVFLSFADPVFPPQPIEKNWCFFEWKGHLCALYDINKIVRVTPNGLAFRLESLYKSTPQFHDYGLSEYYYISLSTSPVPYGGGYIFLIHQRDSTGIYRHWAIQIDSSFAWKAISRFPILEGGNSQGFHHGFLIVGSAAVVGDKLVCAIGEGDYYSGIIEVNLQEITWDTLAYRSQDDK